VGPPQAACAPFAAARSPAPPASSERRYYTTGLVPLLLLPGHPHLLPPEQPACSSQRVPSPSLWPFPSQHGGLGVRRAMAHTTVLATPDQTCALACTVPAPRSCRWWSSWRPSWPSEWRLGSRAVVRACAHPPSCTALEGGKMGGVAGQLGAVFVRDHQHS